MTCDQFLQEFEMESRTTRRVLERVPEDRLGWKPHPRSMSLGSLAMHVAGSPAFITGWALQDSVEAVAGAPERNPASLAEILAVHDASVEKAKAALAVLGDEGLRKDWRMVSSEGATLFTMPKSAVIRSFACNHVYHHRGQLSVYLRLLDVAVPSIYGPSADENPMASASAAAGR